MRNKIFIFLTIAILLVMIFNVIIFNPKIIFSHDNHFLVEDTTIRLRSGFNNNNIFYTLDGSVPTINSYRYENGIELIANEETKLYTIRAKVINERRESEVFTKSYFIGKNIAERFNSLVFVISAEYDDLYGYDNGILIPGRLRSEYLEANPDITNIHPTTPANYNVRGRESERRAFLEVFEPNGKRVINQYITMRVSGNWSRANERKALRLFARVEENNDNVFKYPFFASRKTVKNGQVVNNYRKLQLRKGGQDFRITFLRDVVAQQLALNAGITVSSNSRPAAVFINSEYYGFANLQELTEESFFESVFGSNRSNYFIAGTTEHALWLLRGNPDFNSELIRLRLLWENRSFKDEYIFNQINDAFDLDQFLFYYAFLMYTNNRDSIRNNFLIWKYSEPTDLTIPLGSRSYLDGRWRPIINDFDISFSPGLDMMCIGSQPCRRESAFLRALIQRNDMRYQFINNLLDFMNYYLSPETIINVIDKKYNESKNEIYYYINSRANCNENFTIKAFQENIEKLRYFAKGRPEEIIKGLYQEFGISNIYKLTIKQTNSHIRVNSINLNNMQNDFVGQYFGEIPVTITYMGNKRNFSHWIINGEKHFAKTIYLTGQHVVNNAIQIEIIHN